MAMAVSMERISKCASVKKCLDCIDHDLDYCKDLKHPDEHGNKHLCCELAECDCKEPELLILL